MSTKPKSTEFFYERENGQPSDVALHADILGEEWLTDRMKAEDEEDEPGPGLNKEDELDISDLDELDELIAEMGAAGNEGEEKSKD